MATKAKKKRFMCQWCDRQFRTTRALDHHCLEVHKTKYVLRCWAEGCGKLWDLKNLDAFLRHGWFVHGRNYLVDDNDYWDGVVEEARGENEITYSDTPLEILN